MNTNITALKEEQLDNVQGGLLVTIIAGAAAAASIGALVKANVDFYKYRKSKKAAE